MVLEVLKAKPGTHLFVMRSFDDEQDLCDVFSFESKEAFDKEFETKKHPHYSCNYYLPRVIIKSFGHNVDCMINGENMYINLNHSYLIVDGKLINS
jgi:hypothetical protein